MFGKVFEQILDSSIAEDYLTRFVFEDFLILGYPNGVVDMTHEAFARRTNVPIEIVRASISKLSQPDPRSRSPKEEGRRLILLDDHRDWGWQIVNYVDYRDMRNEESRRDYMRDYMRNRRNSGKQDADSVNTCKQPLAKLAQLELEKELEKEKIKASAASSHEQPAGGVFELPLKDGTSYQVPQDMYIEYCKAYPKVNVEDQLNTMRVWLLVRPGKRKTLAGINTFINGWLKRERDGGTSHRKRAPRAENFGAIGYAKSFGHAPGENVGLL
jgi:hypothetical protein